MPTIPCIVLIPESLADDLSRVWAAQGRGSDTFTAGRKVCEKSGLATQLTPPTHRVSQDNSASDENEALWRAVAAGGDLPAVAWENYGLTEARATAAVRAMTVQSVAGDKAKEVSAESFLDGLGLQFVPGPLI